MRYLKLFESFENIDEICKKYGITDYIINPDVTVRYLKLFESFEDIDEICKKYVIENYTINHDRSIDVNEYVYLSNKGLTKLPLRFNKINGIFNCSHNSLITLEGSPLEVNGSFYCNNNELTSFEFSPKIIRGHFYCYGNNIKSFEGSPKEINVNFSCSYNQLTSFQFAPRIIRGIFFCDNNNIKTFEYFPSFVKDDFICNGNPIWWVWWSFQDTEKIELLNDFDIFRDEDTETPSIIMDRLNDFLLTIGKDPVEKVYEYKNI